MTRREPLLPRALRVALTSSLMPVVFHIYCPPRDDRSIVDRAVRFAWCIVTSRLIVRTQIIRHLNKEAGAHRFSGPYVLREKKKDRKKERESSGRISRQEFIACLPSVPPIFSSVNLGRKARAIQRIVLHRSEYLG